MAERPLAVDWKIVRNAAKHAVSFLGPAAKAKIEVALEGLDVALKHDPKVIAQDVLAMAYAGDMPGSYWQTDRRIARACEVLGINPDDALQITAEAWEEAERLAASEED